MTKVQKLGGGANCFHQADYLIGRYAAKAPVGTTLEDVLHPEYFQNHISSLRPGMMITVVSDDFELDCDLRVLTVTKTTAKMRVIRTLDKAATPKAKADVSGVKVRHAGPYHKYRIEHAGEVIQHGFATEEEALAAAEKYKARITD